MCRLHVFRRAPEAREGWRRLARRLRPRSLRESLRRNTGLKAFSLLLAFFLWFSINVTERDAERVVEMPVTIRKLGNGLLVVNPPTKPVSMTLRGPRNILDGVDDRKGRISLDLTGLTAGDTRLDMNPDMVRPELPRRLKVVRIEPPRLKLRIERLSRRTVPVRADLAGMPTFGYTVAESRVEPDHVEVTGPASKVDDLTEITTEPIDLRGLHETVQRNVLLAWAGDFVTVAPDHTLVTLSFEEAVTTREFKHVVISLRHAESPRTDINPAWVDVVVRGPQAQLHNFKLEDGAAWVDAAGLGPGPHQVAIRVDLPARLDVVHRQPDSARVVVPGRGGR